MKQSICGEEDETDKSDRNVQAKPFLQQIHKQTQPLLAQLKDSLRWNLSSAKYEKEELQKVFTTLKQPPKLKFLWLHWNRIENICKMVIQPVYAELLIMNIGGNDIVSVELLSQANMPKLQELWLWNNKLTKVDCLRKLHAPNLKYIDVSSNLIVEWNRFSQLQSTKLSIVNIQRNLLACVDNFIKNINPKSGCLLNFFDNELISVFGKIVTKKKKTGRLYDFVYLIMIAQREPEAINGLRPQPQLVDNLRSSSKSISLQTTISFTTVSLPNACFNLTFINNRYNHPLLFQHPPMGPTPSHHHFLPSPPHHQQQIMTKVWNFQSQSESLHHLRLIKSIQARQEQEYQTLYCQIVCLHMERVNQGKSWKVIAAFEYPNRSLRQEIILRKKKDKHGPYFTERQVLQILNVAGIFIVSNYSHFCSHSDIFSNIFLYSDYFKICRPQLLPLRCSNRYCSNASLPQKLVDDILELLLLEKVVRASRREKERAQYLYSHSKWLVNFIENVVMERADILALSRQSKYLMRQIKMSEDNRCEKESKGLAEDQRQKKESITPFQILYLQREYQKQQPFQSWDQVNELKIPDKTKASGSMRVRHSHSFELDSEKRQNQYQKSNFYPQKKMLLDHYHHELVESICDHDESNSFNLINPYQNINLTEFDPVTSPNMIETNSLIILQAVPIEEHQSMRINRSFGPSVPTTIIEQDNETYSHEGSKKSIQSHPSQSQTEITVIQRDGCRYEGQTLRGKKHGKGRLTYSNGVYYDGQWVNDQINGYGTLYYAKGKPYYTGFWKNGSFHGKGIFYNEEEQPISGCYDYRDFNEIGRRWKSFQGTFNNDKKNGQGLLTLSNGETLRAEWKNNVIEGRGVFQTLRGQVIRGIWVQNALYVVQSSEN